MSYGAQCWYMHQANAVVKNMIFRIYCHRMAKIVLYQESEVLFELLKINPEQRTSKELIIYFHLKNRAECTHFFIDM